MRRNVLARAVHQYRSDTFHCALGYFGVVQSMQEQQVAARLAPGTRPVLWRHLARDDEAFARGRVNTRDAAEII